jgi:FMN phosphatase YigB (HAD superfamily)
MPEKLILFDIDQTLLNSDRMDPIIDAKFAKILGISTSLVQQIAQQYNEGLASFRDFNIKKYCQFFAERLHAPTYELEQVFEQSELYLPCIEQSTKDVLGRLKVRYSFGIFSEGDPDFQYLKLAKSDLLSFFDARHIYIFPDKTVLKAVHSLPDYSVVVDDSVRVIKALLIYPEKQFRLIKTNQYTDANNDLKVEQIQKLADLLNILEH